MKLAIHHRPGSFSDRWIDYCKKKEIPFKIVNCYDTNIISQLNDCSALMWHHHHTNPKDVLFAKQLLYSIEQSGKIVFPDFNSGWHFDDKLGQKYLFEALNLPLIPSYVFYDKKVAKEWVKKTSYPKVWKLRGGAGSSNVKLVKSKKEALKLINIAFKKRGFSQYNGLDSLKDKWNKFINKTGSIKDVIKGTVRLFYPPYYSKVMGREIGYIYFQDFVPDLEYDYRTKVVDGRCWGYKRLVRDNDFRASGSGSDYYKYGKNVVPIDIIERSQQIAQELNMLSVAFDFVVNSEEKKLLIEASCFYGDNKLEYVGYWDENLNWHEGKFNPQGWMVESLIKEIKKKSTNHV